MACRTSNMLLYRYRNHSIVARRHPYSHNLRRQSSLSVISCCGPIVMTFETNANGRKGRAVVVVVVVDVT